MSLEASKAVWEHSQAKGTARLILLSLADHADEDGVAWPSLSRLAKMANVHVSNISKNLNILIEMGELSRVGTVPSKQGKKGTKYKILIPRTRGVKKAKPSGGAHLNLAEARYEPPLEPSLSLLYREQHQKVADLKANNFDQFWEQYPKRVGKGAARKAYLKAVQNVPHKKIMAGLARYNPDPNFICHPSTWLNQERWDDEQDSSYSVKSKNNSAGGGSSRGEGIVEASERFLARRGLSKHIRGNTD